MIPKTVPKIFLIFFFLFFFFLINPKIVLAEWPSGCAGSDGYWYCSCDPTYCGSNCVCGDVATTGTTAKCSEKNALGAYSCIKGTVTYYYLCCPNWSTSQFCDKLWYTQDCVITPPDMYGQGATCDVVGTDHTSACNRWNVPGPPGGATSTPTTPACSCSWVNQGCSESCSWGSQRLEVYQCNSSACSGAGQTRCVSDSSCCHCHSWVAKGCGANGCPSSQQSFERVCHCNGEDFQFECRADSSCVSCNCGSWNNVGCGQGGCALNRMYQTRSCNPGGCSSTTNCAVDPACAPAPPSCSVNLAPDSLELQAGESGLLAANVAVSNTSIVQVDFTVADESIAQVDPDTVWSAPYITQVNGQGSGNTNVTVVVTTNPVVPGCTETSSVYVGSAAWFQTQGGDIHAQGSLTDRIPSSCILPVCNPNLSLDLNNYPGVVSQKDSINLGDGYPSKSRAGNWVAKSEYKGLPYAARDFFMKKFATQMATPVSFNPNLPSENKVYYYNSGGTLSGNWNLAGNRWVVILANGDVNIPVNINVDKTSFLAIVSTAETGKITFANSVTQAQGMFVANTIDTGESATAFAGEGIFAASTFALNRDFADARNRNTPVETFIARPDFLMSSYKSKDENLWWFFQKWQELAP